MLLLKQNFTLVVNRIITRIDEQHDGMQVTCNGWPLKVVKMYNYYNDREQAVDEVHEDIFELSQHSQIHACGDFGSNHS